MICFSCAGSGINAFSEEMCRDCNGTGSEFDDQNNNDLPDHDPEADHCRCDHCIPF